ncbi:MAG: hypothetical protein JRF69_02380 [Deltaproteobacteria bacterium]|nr:hypothetical protein [Deltaproteobacteria bacterium]
MKPHQPKIQCLLPSPRGYVPLDDLTSQAPMRLTRRGDPPAADPGVSYGRYFEGVTDVMSQDGYEPLVQATSRQVGRDILLSDIDQILIHAEKHGSDYHPARIEVVVGADRAAFVMNVAITARGKAWLCREFEVLQGLNRRYSYRFLPQAYFQGEAFHESGSDKNTMLMFLADWFQGYYEFHLSIDKRDGAQGLLVWDTEKSPYFLSRSQTREVYHQTSKMLTLYYDVETFEQIFPWHHAAGDFVVKADGESIDVRLITARQYTPMLDRSEGVSAHEALLFFLLNLSIRMRLDRLDGVGPVAWANDGCVQATLEGFIEGLAIKEQREVIPGGFLDAFIRDIKSSSVEELSHGFHTLVDACDQLAPDIPVIRNHLKKHASKLHTIVQGLNDL